MSDITVLDIDPFSAENLCYPYESQAAFRDAGPVFWLSRYQTYGVARHAEVTALLENAGNFISSAGIGLDNLRSPKMPRQPSPIAEADPPQHTSIRKGMNKIAHPKVIKQWRPLFEEGAVRHFDAVLGNGEIDGLVELSEAYIHSVFPIAVGIEPNRENLLIVGHHNGNAAGPYNDLTKASQAALEGIWDWYQHHQTAAAMIPSGMGDMIFAAEARGDIPPNTASNMMRTVLRGGLDTTISTIGSTLMYLAHNPDQWALLKEDHSLIIPAFEEALRLESPTSSIYRTTEGDARVAGIALEPNTKVQVFIGAANRDPRKWGEDAGVFDIRRDHSGHLGFGNGNHLCLGRNIARLEAECFFSEFLKRVAAIELAGEPVFRPVNMLRTLKNLPLKITLH